MPSFDKIDEDHFWGGSNLTNENLSELLRDIHDDISGAESDVATLQVDMSSAQSDILTLEYCTVETIAALMASPIDITLGRPLVIRVQGYYVKSDGGGGSFYWDSSSVAVENGGTVVAKTGHVGAGRWIRLTSDEGPTVFNVRAFGAKGTGDVNDVSYIQAAIDASAESYVDFKDAKRGGIVYFPTGTYRIHDKLILPTYIILKGPTPPSFNPVVGYNGARIYCSNSNALIGAGDNWLDYSTADAGAIIVIEDIKFEGRYDYNNPLASVDTVGNCIGNFGVVGTGSRTILLNRVEITLFPEDGIQCVNGRYSRLQSCNISKCGGRVFHLLGGNLVRLVNTRFVRSRSTDYGVYLEATNNASANSITIDSCTFEGSDEHSLALVGVEGARISGCWFEGNVQSGSAFKTDITITQAPLGTPRNCSGIEISGNYFVSGGVIGGTEDILINVVYGSGIVILGNKFTHVLKGGITPVTRYAYQFGANSEQCLAQGNVFSPYSGVGQAFINEHYNDLGTKNIIHDLKSSGDQRSGTFDWTGTSATFVVPNTNIKATSRIAIFPTNSNAAALCAGAQHPYVSAKTANTSFTLSTQDGLVKPSASCVFDYLIMD